MRAGTFWYIGNRQPSPERTGVTVRPTDTNTPPDTEGGGVSEHLSRCPHPSSHHAVLPDGTRLPLDSEGVPRQSHPHFAEECERWAPVIKQVRERLGSAATVNVFYMMGEKVGPRRTSETGLRVIVDGWCDWHLSGVKALRDELSGHRVAFTPWSHDGHYPKFNEHMRGVLRIGIQEVE